MSTTAAIDNPATPGTPLALPRPDTDGDDTTKFVGTISEFVPFDIDTNNILECGTTDCGDRTGADLGAGIWVKFTEEGTNESTFANTNADDDASLKTKANAQRGLSFSIEYDNTMTAGIGFSTTTIVIDAGDEWNSGQNIGITVTDSDANTNSLVEETLEIADPDRIIPTIRIGSPFTLGEAEDSEAYTTTIVSDILVMSEDATYDTTDPTDHRIGQVE